MKTLIFIEQRNNEFKASSLELINAAREITSNPEELAAVIVAGDSTEIIKELTDKGISTIYNLQSEALLFYNVMQYAKAVDQAISTFKPKVLIASASPIGRDLLPRLAARHKAGMLTDLTKVMVEGEQLKGIKPLFAGKCLAKVAFQGEGLCCVSIRPNNYPRELTGESGSANVENLEFSAEASKLVTKEVRKGASQKADLTEAARIISGGRAMGAADAFKILDECADKLNATVGASRAAVDAGYAPHSQQVGQTGKTVNPNLYIACGISGSIQHMAGMRTSKVIVAINTDPEAPIFKVADYAIVGDLFEVVPVLTRRLASL